MSISIEEKQLLNKIRKIKEKSSANEIHHLSNFLNVREQELYNSVFKDDSFYQLDGGYDDAEYKRAIYSTGYDFDFKIIILAIKRTDSKEITHRNVLGTIMATGVTRESVGDILINREYIYIFVRDTIANHLIKEVISICGVIVELTIATSVKIEKQDKFEEKTIFVDSLRLDNIISKVYNISRSLAQEMIKKELVKVNHSDVDKYTKKISINSVVSVRKHGRFKVLSNLGKSKSSKNILLIAVYK